MTTSDPIQMVSAFRGLNELIPVKRGAGIVMDWKQSSGTLTIGGDSRVVRVWDAHTETQLSVRFLSFFRSITYDAKIVPSGPGYSIRVPCYSNCF
jgi:hypothetical protein